MPAANGCSPRSSALLCNKQRSRAALEFTQAAA
jgi:hypothetical protein